MVKRIIFLSCLILSLLMVLRICLPYILLKSNPDMALRIQPNNPTLLMERNNNMVVRGSLNQFEKSQVKSGALRALKRGPLMPEALVQVASLSHDTKNIHKAEDIYTLAQLLDGRNRQANLALYNIGVSTENVDLIAEQLNLMINVNRSQFRSILPALVEFSKIESSHDFFFNSFQNNISWALPFAYAIIDDEEVSPDFSLKILRYLRDNKNHNFDSLPILERLVRHLVQKEAFVKAHNIWNEFYKGSELSGDLIINSQFQPSKIKSPFNWQTFQNRNGYGEIKREGGVSLSSYGKGNVLLLRQYISLESGLSYRMMSEAYGKFSKRQGQFSLLIRCAEDGAIITQYDYNNMTGKWVDVQHDFVLDENSCPIQRVDVMGLQGEYPSRIGINIKSLDIVPTSLRR